MNQACHRLTKTELRILQLLSQGKTYQQIQTSLRISAACLHVHCSNLRKKAGIETTKSSEQCHAFLHGYSNPGKYLPPLTTRQLDVLHLLAEGRSYVEIANILEMCIQSAQNHAWKACKRAGIHRAGHQRTRLIREYLAQRGTPKADAMSDPAF